MYVYFQINDVQCKSEYYSSKSATKENVLYALKQHLTKDQFQFFVLPNVNETALNCTVQ